MRALYLAVAAAALTTNIQASDLDITIQSGGSSAVSVEAGATVSYEVIGELSDSANEGLGLVLLDLAFDGGDLTQADEPLANPMANFANPLGDGPGLTNPDGYGGTLIGGSLIQIGGAQNTINASFANAPSGAVITGVAVDGSPEVLVTGELTAPTAPGTYVLSLSKLTANVIVQGETGVPFWRVEPAGTGTVTDLVITIETGCYNNLGFAGPGNIALEICGQDLTVDDSEAIFSLTGAAPSSQAFIVFGLEANPTPFKGGVLVPIPIALIVDFVSTDANGAITFPIRGGPSDQVTLFIQTVVPNGLVFEFSNAVQITLGR